MNVRAASNVIMAITRFCFKHFRSATAGVVFALSPASAAMHLMRYPLAAAAAAAAQMRPGLQPQDRAQSDP